MNSKYKKLILTSILILLISSLGIFVLGVDEAKADTLGIVDGLKSILGGFLLMVQEIIGSLVAWLAGLSQGILNFTNIQKAQMVKDGWEIVRDLANMFFVLILLAISFATILRIETYGMKSLLPKLIIAALLINFSLVFAGVFIDFAGVLTDFFIGGSTNFFENIADEMGLTHIQTTTAQDSGEYWQCITATPTGYIYSGRFKTGDCNGGCTEPLANCEKIIPPKVDWGDIQGDIFWKVIGALFLSIIFTVIAAFVFGALAFFLFIRIIIIWFLLILAPIAWFFWILPATRNLWSQWWNTFLKWVFFAPAAVFFIWLSVNSWLKFIQGQAPKLGGEMITGMKEIIADETIQGMIIPNVMRPENLIQFFIACGMLIGSLIVAQKIGIYGAQGAIGIARGAGKGVAKWTGRRAQILATRPIGGRVGAMGDKLRAGLGKVPIARQALRPTRALAEKERADMAETEKKYSGRTSDNLKSEYKAVNPRNKAAIAKILADRGDFKIDDKLGFTEEEIKKATQLAKRYEQHGDVLKARPDLAPLVGEDIKEIVSKIKPADMEKLQTEALIGKAGEEVKKAIQDQLTNPNGRWKSSHLSKMNEVNPSIAVEIKQKIIDNPGRKPFRQDVETYLNSEAGKAIFGEPNPRAEKEVPFAT